ncbi:hypothetical protein BDZ85DRAFT_260216 [Elsinoe ampelina]|uniref:Uncharacterized protein n=1 Tax=Elsinoe ampelina TaxID=302913 RepID=A0A6A6GER9_9PEZI|nr:hypothetical protein BDZ85DRAFT_260216 [Elsinoe ampelina]
MVDQEALDSVLEATPPPNSDPDDEAHVIIIDRQWKRLFADGSYEPFSDDENAAQEDLSSKELADQGYPEVEGCTRDDVGWMNTWIGTLTVRTYTSLLKIGWDHVYERPPEITVP